LAQICTVAETTAAIVATRSYCVLTVVRNVVACTPQRTTSDDSVDLVIRSASLPAPQPRSFLARRPGVRVAYQPSGDDATGAPHAARSVTRRELVTKIDASTNNPEGKRRVAG